MCNILSLHSTCTVYLRASHSVQSFRLLVKITYHSSPSVHGSNDDWFCHCKVNGHMRSKTWFQSSSKRWKRAFLVFFFSAKRTIPYRISVLCIDDACSQSRRGVSSQRELKGKLAWRHWYRSRLPRAFMWLICIGTVKQTEWENRRDQRFEREVDDVWFVSLLSLHVERNVLWDRICIWSVHKHQRSS